MQAPKNDSNIGVYTPFLVTYTVAKSKSTTTEDYVYAKARTFNGDGSLVNTKVIVQKSSFVSATATNTSIYYGDDAIGNHTYKLSGYNDVNHETKAFW